MFLFFSILIPLAGFLACVTLFRRNASTAFQVALGASGLSLLTTLALVPEVTQNPTRLASTIDWNWISYPPIHFHLGVDGLSLWLIVATALLTLIAIGSASTYVGALPEERNPGVFLGWLLFLQAAITGVFAAQDLFLFYVFFELTLVPCLFLMGQWGTDQGGSTRTGAAVQFFLYTFAASILMLGGIIYVFLKSGTFDYRNILSQLAAGSLRFTPAEQAPLFVAFFLAFAVKTPLFPFHAWQANAYATSPTALTIVMAGMMGKLGTYGMLRFVLPLFPTAARAHVDMVSSLAILAILYGGLMAIVQPNLKRLLAYSSLSHLGFVVLGIFSFHQNGLDGASYQMVCHAITTGALFLMAGYLESRRQSSEIADFGGIATQAPWLSSAFLFVALASTGLPMLSNFVGEYLILQGAAYTGMPYAVAAAVGVILSAVYLLWAYQRTFLGAAGEQRYLDLEPREVLLAAPLLALTLWLGIQSPPFLGPQSAVTAKILEQTKMNVEFRVNNDTPNETAVANAD
ncbi:MAG: NADH-quinone oxidoreductase subunit M [Bryobacter sp.]